jgi:hypothetical protein
LTSLSGSLASSSGPSVDIGGDQVTTSIDVSLSYEPESGSALVGLQVTSGAIATGIAWLLWPVKTAADACLENLPDCVALGAS